MERVLLIRFGSLGDVILTLPVIEAIRRHAPSARVSFAVKEAYRSLFEGPGTVDRVFPLSGSNGSLRGYADRLRAESFDLVIDLHASLRSRILCRMLGAPRVERVSLEHLRRRALVHFRRPLLGYPEHVVDRYLEAAGRCGIPPAGRVPKLQIPEEARGRMAARLETLGWRHGDRLVALSPGAGRKTKRWDPERFADLGRRLAEAGPTAVVVTGSDDEADGVRDIVRGAAHEKVFPFIDSDLLEQGALLSAASRLVTNDSGLMHLAVAAGTPVVALFGPTAPSLGFRPLGERDVVLSVPLDCRPCSLHGRDRCPRGDTACMDLIGVDRVLEAATEETGGRR